MLKVILVTMGIAIIGFFPLLGIPGTLVMLAGLPPVNLVFGSLAWEAWNLRLGDRAWPLAIVLSILWPWLIPLAYLATQKIFPGAAFFSAKSLAVLGLTLAVGIPLMGFVATVSTGPVKRLTRQEIVATAVKVGSLSALREHYRPEDLTTFTRDPLIEAIFGQYVPLAEFLISRRDNLNQYFPASEQDSGQFASPLQTAVNVASIPIVASLLEKGANPNITNAAGQTPLFSVEWDPKGNGDIIRLLKKHGANFSVVDKNGDTPLMVMTREVHNHWPEMAVYAKLMVEAGVNPKHVNYKGKTALDYAKEEHHDTTVEYLRGLSHY
jgi:hypothetical protein